MANCYLKIYAYKVTVRFKVEDASDKVTINPGEDSGIIVVPEGKKVYIGYPELDNNYMKASFIPASYPQFGGSYFPEYYGKIGLMPSLAGSDVSTYYVIPRSKDINRPSKIAVIPNQNRLFWAACGSGISDFTIEYEESATTTKTTTVSSREYTPVFFPFNGAINIIHVTATDSNITGWIPDYNHVDDWNAETNAGFSPSHTGENHGLNVKTNCNLVGDKGWYVVNGSYGGNYYGIIRLGPTGIGEPSAQDLPNAGYYRKYATNYYFLSGMKSMELHTNGHNDNRTIYAGDMFGYAGTGTAESDAVGQYDPEYSIKFTGLRVNGQGNGIDDIYYVANSAVFERGFGKDGDIVAYPYYSWPGGSQATWTLNRGSSAKIDVPGDTTTVLAPGRNRTINVGAVWEEITDYIINIYDNDGTTVKGTLSATAGTSVTVGPPTDYGISAPDSTYTFYGYCENVNALYPVIPSGGSVTKPDTQTYSLYPVWKKGDAYKSVLHEFGGNTEQIDTFYVNGNIRSTLPAKGSTSGWTHVSWANNPNYSGAMVPGQGYNLAGASPVTVFEYRSDWYAVYSRSISIQYSGNGNTSGTAPSSVSGTQYYNASGSISSLTVTLPDKGTLVRTNYEFVGWSETSTYTPGTTYPQPGDSYTFTPTVSSTSTIKVLYAVWKPTTVTIVYKPNRGTGTDVVNTPNIGATDYKIIDAPTSWSRTGYKLIGWNTNSDWAPGVTTGDKYYLNQPLVPSNDLTLFAVWYPLFKWTGDDTPTWTDNDSVDIDTGKPTTNATAAKWNELETKIKNYVDADYSATTTEVSKNPMIVSRFKNASNKLGVVLVDGEAGKVIIASNFTAVKEALNNQATYL